MGTEKRFIACAAMVLLFSNAKLQAQNNQVSIQKSRNRPNGPGGRYDGTYVQDWEYVGGAGRLDRCNGGMLNGKFIYFATTTYPFYPRCLWGNASSDFRR